MAIEFTNIAAKRQLISVSEFRPILDIIFVLFSLACVSLQYKRLAVWSGLMAVKGFWTENVIDCSKLNNYVLSELEKMALMEDIKLHAGVSFQIE